MLQNSQENTCARVSFLIKLQAWGLRPATLLKTRLWHRCFPVNFQRTPLLQNTLWRLLLTGSKSNISYYRTPFGTDPESLSLRKRWIAAIRRENWTDNQIYNSRICCKHFIIGKSKKTLMVSSLVFLFVSVAFSSFVVQASNRKIKILQIMSHRYFSLLKVLKKREEIQLINMKGWLKDKKQ